MNNKKTLEQIQREAWEWSNHNFPKQIDFHSFVGVQEEVGELGDCLLQNFEKGSEEQFLFKAIGSVGEAAHRYLKKTQHIRENGESIRAESLAKIAHMSHEEREEMKKDAIGDILIFLLNYCSHRKYDVSEILNETWEAVRQRDWVKFPKDGTTE